MILQSGQSAAQTLLWPTDRAQAAQPPRPGEPAPSASRTPPLPLMGAVPPPPVGSPLGGGVPPALRKFAKLREEVQKRGLVAKTAGRLKARREEICTLRPTALQKLKMG